MAGQDFRVEIGTGDSNGYEVILRAPDGAEASQVMSFPVTLKQLDTMAARVPASVLIASDDAPATAAGGRRALREVGGLLFDALFGENGRAIFTTSRNQAAARGELLRLVLQIRSPELARMPWEYLFDSQAEAFVSLGTPLIRYPLALVPTKPMQVTPPLRVLGMVARPNDQGGLADGEEVSRLEEALKELVRAGLIELDWVAGQTWRDLQDAIFRGPWHIFHFIGHGQANPADGEASLTLAAEDGSSYRLEAEDLAILFSDHFPLRLVVLNACDTDLADLDGPFPGVARTLIQNGAPAVVAMRNKITDRAAIEFSRTFYKGLAHLQPVDVAAMHARRSMRLSQPGSVEWTTPVLYMRSPDGDLFEAVGPARTPSEPAALTGVRTAVSVNALPTTQPPEPAGPFQEGPALQAMAQQAGAPPAQVAPTLVFPDPVEVAVIRTQEQVNAVCFSVDANLIGVACDGRVALVVDEIGREHQRLRHDPGTNAVRAIHIGPAGDRAATAAERNATIWDISNGASLIRVSHQDSVRGVALSPDGRLLATGSTDRTARTWDAGDGRPLHSLPHPDGVFAVAFSPDGQLLATACADGSAWLWSTTDGCERRHLAHKGTVRAVAFSPDGRLLATAGSDGTARIWETATGEQRAAMQHAGLVRAVTFSPAGRLLATASSDGTARIWETATGEQRANICDTGPLRTATFSPDGRLLATGGHDRCVRLWRTGKDSHD